VASNGQRVISPENLDHLWKKRVSIDAQIGYGLGWHVEDYHGLTVLHHPGGTVGFAAELVIIPEQNLGFALLTNRLDMVAPIGRMATYRLLEMLTGSEQVYDHQIAQTKRELQKQVIALSLMTKKRVDPAEIAPFLGPYHNEVLGEVILIIHNDHSLWVDIGEYEIPIRPLRLEENQYILYESIFIGKTLVLGTDSSGRPRMTLPGDEDTYHFLQAPVP
jgi:hypothetical protein